MSQASESLFHGDLVTSRRSIYTPSRFARENLLYLQEAGSLQARRPHTSSRSGLDSYLFFLVISGSGELTVFTEQDRHSGSVLQANPRSASSGRNVISLHIGDCVFLDCRNPYSHTTSGDLWQLKWVHFNGSAMPGIYEKFLERSGGPVFHSSTDSTLSWQLDRIFNLSESDSYVRDMEINAAIASLLTSVMEESWNPEVNRSRQGTRHAAASGRSSSSSQAAPAGAVPAFRISDVRDYIQDHYAENTTLDELAARFHFNKYYLVRLFREQYGTTIGAYRTHLRINEAKKLLRFTSLSLAEAGARVGFDDANYFSRIFRKVEGITPGEYRRSW